MYARGPQMIVAIMVCSAVLAGCSSIGRVSSAAPPTVVCGTTLSHSAAGPVMEDASSGPITINSVTVGGDIYLKLTSDCETGAEVAILPASGAAIVKQARTRDGALAAIVLHPVAKRFSVQVKRANGTIDLVKVSL